MTEALAALVVVALAAAARGITRAVRREGVARRLHGARAPGHEAPPVRSLPNAPPWLGGWLEAAAVDLDPARAWWGWLLISAVLASSLLVFAGAGAACLVLAVLTLGPVLVLRSRRGQGDLRVERELPAALEAVARSLRSGASLRQALAEAASVTPGRLGRELASVGRRVEHGAPLVEALEGMAVANILPGVRLTVAALCLGVETGGAQARAVDGVASTLRDRLGVAAEVRALSSQARMSALVIGLAPIAFGGFAIATDPRTGAFLFHTPLGLTLVAIGCGLDAVGWLWMQRLVRVPA
jgi:tight adherence protein B